MEREDDDIRISARELTMIVRPDGMGRVVDDDNTS